MQEQYRQGDVFVVRVDEVPAGVKQVPREDGKVVLAHGEVTGHAHAIVEDEATLYHDPDLERRFLDEIVDGPVALIHEEHSTITLPPGVYEVRRQREYSPEAIRTVAD